MAKKEISNDLLLQKCNQLEKEIKTLSEKNMHLEGHIEILDTSCMNLQFSHDDIKRKSEKLALELWEARQNA